MTIRPLAVLLLYCGTFALADVPPRAEAPVTFLPGRSIFPIVPANHEEPHLGLTKDIATSHMRLDIGSSMDLVNIRVSADSTTNIRAGADLFAFALSTSYNGLRLQIDALDGYFGGHIVYRNQREGSALLLRLRIMHLSSHLIDGHYDNDADAWIGGRKPLHFSRDYGEVTAGYLWQWNGAGVFAYGGFSYATLVRPSEQKRLNTLYGITAHTSRWTGGCFGKPLNLYVSEHFLLWGVDELSGTNGLEAGVKFGAWEGAGVRVFVSYHSGLEIYHQYSDVTAGEWGVGFELEP
jgi:hypothetical protein